MFLAMCRNLKTAISMFLTIILATIGLISVNFLLKPRFCHLVVSKLAFWHLDQLTF